MARHPAPVRPVSTPRYFSIPKTRTAILEVHTHTHTHTLLPCYQVCSQKCRTPPTSGGTYRSEQASSALLICTSAPPLLLHMHSVLFTSVVSALLISSTKPVDGIVGGMFDGTHRLRESPGHQRAPALGVM